MASSVSGRTASSVLSMAPSFHETRRVDPAGRRTERGRSRKKGGRESNSLIGEMQN